MGSDTYVAVLTGQRGAFDMADRPPQYVFIRTLADDRGNTDPWNHEVPDEIPVDRRLGAGNSCVLTKDFFELSPLLGLVNSLIDEHVDTVSEQ